jgi:hypothetical protein
MAIFHYFQMNAARLATYSMFFLMGFFGYYLRYFSFSSVVQKLPHEHFPFVLLLQGVISFFAVKYSLIVFSKMKKNSIFLIIGVICLFCYPLAFNAFRQNIIFGYALFVISLIGASLLQSYFIGSFLNKDDVAAEPLFTTKILLFEEIGAFVSATLTLQFGFGEYSLALAAIFILLLIVSPRAEIKLRNEKVENLQSFFPFGETLVNLFIVFMLCKVFYSYLLFESLRVVQDSGSDFLVIFAKFTALEAILSIILLFFRAGGLLNTSWPKAFAGFFVVTFILMSALAITTNFYLALVACGLAKVWQKVILKDSTHNIYSSLPIKVRLFYWSESEKNSYLFAYPIIVLVSAGIIFLGLDRVLIGIFMLGFAIIGFLLLKKLVETITQFHIANMARSDSKGAYVSCLALEVLKAEEHKSALIAMLSKTDDIRLMKAIIHILGQIQDQQSIETLMKHYHECEKEDIQLAIVTALVKFSSHEVDLFLLEALQEIINKQTSLGEIRRSLFLRITERLKDVAIPMILKILKSNDQDHRIIANALIVLGEIALRRKDRDVFLHIQAYLKPSYSRRVRSNAILYLFQSKEFKKKAYSIFEEFLTSQEEHDKAAAAFLAGELELRGITPFIWENSVSASHKNPTLLFSLLKLSFAGVPKFVAEFILTAEREKSLLAVNQLSSINNHHTRYLVYKEVMKKTIEELRAFMDLLKESGRDFDEDLRILEEEIEHRQIA